MQPSICCRGGRTELVLPGPGIARGSGDDAISYRVNDRPAVQVTSAVTAFGPGVAFAGDVVRLLQSLADSGDFIVLLAIRPHPHRRFGCNEAEKHHLILQTTPPR